MCPKKPGFSEVAVCSEHPVEERIYASWLRYLHHTLGRDPQHAHERALAEVTRQRAKSLVIRLRSNGWPIRDMRIVDIGSGHGTLAVELALAGARVTAVEPCDAWRKLSQERARLLKLPITHVAADAQALPFSDAAFDGCVSLQVLEHVPNPEAAISEMSRILRPHGYFYITSENYLAFREQHYGVPWLPLLPKSLGAFYLRLLRRDPSFLRDHVTYVTWPRLVRSFLRNGLIDGWWERYFSGDLRRATGKLRVAHDIASLFLREHNARRAVFWLANLRRVFRVGFVACGRKC